MHVGLQNPSSWPWQKVKRSSALWKITQDAQCGQISGSELFNPQSVFIWRYFIQTFVIQKIALVKRETRSCAQVDVPLGENPWLCKTEQSQTSHTLLVCKVQAESYETSIPLQFSHLVLNKSGQCKAKMQILVCWLPALLHSKMKFRVLRKIFPKDLDQKSSLNKHRAV